MNTLRKLAPLGVCLSVLSVCTNAAENIVVEAESFIGTGGANSGFQTYSVGSVTAINWFETGDFGDYEITVDSHGFYDVSIFAGTQVDGAAVDFILDPNGEAKTLHTAVSNNGSWDLFEAVELAQNLELSAGTHLFRIVGAGANGWEFNADRFVFTRDDDIDKDGVTNPFDICPDSNPSGGINSDGCDFLQKVNDTDSDEVPNEIDECPNTPILRWENRTVEFEVNEVGCADVEIDSDGDGLPDFGDMCPDTPSGESIDVNGCSSSQWDMDEDGVTYHYDHCPDVYGETENHGCPYNNIPVWEEPIIYEEVKATRFEHPYFPGLHAIVANDTDLDGDLDLFAGSRAETGLYNFDNVGSFMPYEKLFNYQRAFHTVVDLVAGDLNGDGINEMVAGYMDRGAIVIYGASEDGPVTLSVVDTYDPQTYQSASGFAKLEIVDLDSDGDNDIVGLDIFVKAMVWYENDGDMNFSEHLLLSDVEFTDLDADDLDRDGDVDIVVIDELADTLVVLENDGSEVFTENTIAEINGISSVVIADLNENSVGDIIVTGDEGYLAWFENFGNMNFYENVLVTNAQKIYKPTVADIDADGDMDLIASSDAEFKIFEQIAKEQFLTRNGGGNTKGEFTVANIMKNGEVELIPEVIGTDYFGWYSIGESVWVTEGTLVERSFAATDDTWDELSYKIYGEDAHMFSIDEYGLVSFVAPARNNDNIYSVWVSVTDGQVTLNNRLEVIVKAVSQTVVIEAEDFVATGGAHEGVEAITFGDTEAINHVQTGDWAEYEFFLVQAGEYDLEAVISTPIADSAMEVFIDGVSVGIFDIPANGGWENFASVKLLDNMALEGGAHTLKIEGAGPYANGWEWNLDRLELLRQ